MSLPQLQEHPTVDPSTNPIQIYQKAIGLFGKRQRFELIHRLTKWHVSNRAGRPPIRRTQLIVSLIAFISANRGSKYVGCLSIMLDISANPFGHLLESATFRVSLDSGRSSGI